MSYFIDQAYDNSVNKTAETIGTHFLNDRNPSVEESKNGQNFILMIIEVCLVMAQFYPVRYQKNGSASVFAEMINQMKGECYLPEKNTLINPKVEEIQLYLKSQNYNIEQERNSQIKPREKTPGQQNNFVQQQSAELKSLSESTQQRILGLQESDYQELALQNQVCLEGIRHDCFLQTFNNQSSTKFKNDLTEYNKVFTKPNVKKDELKTTLEILVIINEEVILRLKEFLQSFDMTDIRNYFGEEYLYTISLIQTGTSQKDHHHHQEKFKKTETERIEKHEHDLNAQQHQQPTNQSQFKQNNSALRIQEVQEAENARKLLQQQEKELFKKQQQQQQQRLQAQQQEQQRQEELRQQQEKERQQEQQRQLHEQQQLIKQQQEFEQQQELQRQQQQLQQQKLYQQQQIQQQQEQEKKRQQQQQLLQQQQQQQQEQQQQQQKQKQQQQQQEKHQQQQFQQTNNGYNLQSQNGVKQSEFETDKGSAFFSNIKTPQQQQQQQQQQQMNQNINNQNQSTSSLRHLSNSKGIQDSRFKDALNSMVHLEKSKMDEVKYHMRASQHETEKSHSNSRLDPHTNKAIYSKGIPKEEHRIAIHKEKEEQERLQQIIQSKERQNEFLNQTLKLTNKDLSNSREQNSQLENTVALLNERLISMESGQDRIGQVLTEQNNNLIQENLALRGDINVLRDEVADVHNDLRIQKESSSFKAQQQEELIQQLKKQLKEEQEKAKLSQDGKEMQHDLFIKNLKESLDTTIALKNKSEEANNLTINRLENLQTQYSTLTEQHNQLLNANKDQQLQTQALRDQLEESKRTHQKDLLALRDELNQKSNYVDKLQQGKGAVSEQIEQLKIQNNKLNEELIEKQLQMDKLSDTINNFEIERMDEQRYNQDIRTVHENERYIKLREKMYSDNAQHEEQQMSLKREIAQLQSKLTDAQSKVNELAAQLQESKNQLLLETRTQSETFRTSLDERVKKFQAQIDSKEEERISVLRREQAAQQEIINLKKQVSEAEVDVKDLSLKIDILQQECQKAHTSEAASIQNFLQIQDQVLVLSTESTKQAQIANSEKTQLLKQISQLEQKNEDLKANRNGQNEKLGQISMENAELQSQIEKLKEENAQLYLKFETEKEQAELEMNEKFGELTRLNVALQGTIEKFVQEKQLLAQLTQKGIEESNTIKKQIETGSPLKSTIHKQPYFQKQSAQSPPLVSAMKLSEINKIQRASQLQQTGGVTDSKSKLHIAQASSKLEQVDRSISRLNRGNPNENQPFNGSSLRQKQQIQPQETTFTVLRENNAQIIYQDASTFSYLPQNSQAIYKFKRGSLKDNFPLFQNEEIQVGMITRLMQEENHLDLEGSLEITLFFTNRTDQYLTDFNVVFSQGEGNRIQQYPVDLETELSPGVQITQKLCISFDSIPFQIILADATYKVKSHGRRVKFGIPNTLNKYLDARKIESDDSFQQLWMNENAILLRSEQFQLDEKIISKPQDVMNYFRNVIEVSNPDINESHTNSNCYIGAAFSIPVMNIEFLLRIGIDSTNSSELQVLLLNPQQDSTQPQNLELTTLEYLIQTFLFIFKKQN